MDDPKPNRDPRWEQLLGPQDGADVRLRRAFLSEIESYRAFLALSERAHWRNTAIKIGSRDIMQPREIAAYGERSYGYSGIHVHPEPWHTLPEIVWLRSAVEAACEFKFNHVLLNHYRGGQDSISWHADNEPELGVSPLIASLSLGATRTFEMRRRNERKFLRLPLESGDLLVMAGETQKNFLHRVPKEPGAQARINLTFRRVI